MATIKCECDGFVILHLGFMLRFVFSLMVLELLITTAVIFGGCNAYLKVQLFILESWFLLHIRELFKFPVCVIHFLNSVREV